MQKSLLLIGSSGFLGSHLRAAAEAAGVAVTAPGRRGGEGGPSCDLLDPESVAACLDEAVPDLIVNAAGAPSVAGSWGAPQAAFAVHVDGTLNLLEAIVNRAPAAHLVCLSSAEVYGESDPVGGRLGEERRPRPLTPYGASKAAMEVICGQYARARGLRVAVVRAFNLLGPGQPRRFAASGFARQVALAERDGAVAVELALGNPDAARDFSDVRDAARALLELSRQRLVGTYNLCSGTATTIAELAAGLGGATALPLRPRQDPGLARPADPSALVGDPSRLREAIGYEPQIPLERSLADLLAWWRTELGGPEALAPISSDADGEQHR